MKIESSDNPRRLFYADGIALSATAEVCPASDDHDEPSIDLGFHSEPSVGGLFRNAVQEIAGLTVAEAKMVRGVLDAAIRHAEWLGSEPVPLTAAEAT